MLDLIVIIQILLQVIQINVVAAVKKSIGYYDSILGKIPNVRKRMIGLLTGCSSVGVNAEHHDLSVGRRGDRPRTGKFALNVQVFRVA